MSDFVDRWAELVLLTIEPGEHADCDPQIRARGSVLLSGAEESQLAEFEIANGVRLPPSYREFLLRTNGALADLLPLRGSGVQPGDYDFTGFVGIEQLSLRIPPPGLWSGLHHKDTIATAYDGDGRVSEWEYLSRPDVSDVVRNGHYRHVMSVADGTEDGQVLLNPLMRQPDGEWEAWEYSYKNPGSYRFRSFRDLIEYRCDWFEEDYGPLTDETRRRAQADLAASVSADSPYPEPPDDIESLVAEFLTLSGDGQSWQIAIQIADVARRCGAETVPFLAQSINRELDRDLTSMATFVQALAWIGGDEAHGVIRDLFPRIMELDHRPQVNHVKGTIVEAMATVGDDRSTSAVLTYARRVETRAPSLIARLGRFKHPDTAAVLAEIIEDPAGPYPATQREAAILALEDLATEEARTYLASLDEITGWRCLARLGDPQALEPLTQLVEQGGVTGLQALHGLRDLADPATEDTVLQVISTEPAESDQAAVAAHTLALLNTSSVEQQLRTLRSRTMNEHATVVLDEWLDHLDPGS